MTSLDRKLARELWQLKGQALAIALVITAGIATFVMSLATLESLQVTQTSYYRDYRFADIFVSLKRAPELLVADIADIPGVARVESRVSGAANIEIDGFDEPVTGQLLSIPDDGQPGLNRLYLKSGRLVEAGRDDEIIVSELFAVAHSLNPGDRLRAVINGRSRELQIVGIALSPEFIYAIGPGMLFPDNKRFGVMWMARTPLGRAFDLDGAFSDLVLSLSDQSRSRSVIEHLDRLLLPYGGLGAIGRDDQVSHKYLSAEFASLRQLATMFPIIFLGVSAFLLNVVITRLVGTQREQIAILKAFGYRNAQIGGHYFKLVLLIVGFGAMAGIALGAWLGQGLSELFMRYYRFPFLEFYLNVGLAMVAVMISFAAAALGTLNAVRKAAQLPPAEAMRPEPPARYRPVWFERIGLQRWLSQPSRMIIRHLGRQPVKSLLSVIGIALACAIMMVGSFQEDAVDYMMDVQYGLASREDLTVTFTEPTSRRALFELQQLPGVEYGEAFRAAPVWLHHRHRRYQTSILGLQPGADLQRILNIDLQPIHLPETGVVLTDYLADKLDVKPGDTLRLEILEGNRPQRQTIVAGIVKEYVGLSAYMPIDSLNRLLREGNTISGVRLAADLDQFDEIYRRIKEMPRVAGTLVRSNAIRSFYETFAETMLVFTSINTLLAGVVAFGVVYNSARIAVSERSRELASLRVLGFTRGEISYIMLGELTLLTLASLPLGFMIGRSLSAMIANSLQTELYRVPLIVEASTYAFAAAVVIAAALLSGLVVRRRLDHLDLIAVLKTKE